MLKLFSKGFHHLPSSTEVVPEMNQDTAWELPIIKFTAKTVKTATATTLSSTSAFYSTKKQGSTWFKVFNTAKK